jgi:hypothetical protein
MAPKRVIAFLLSVAPIFLALLWLWQSLGLDVYYHAALGTILDLVYPHISPAGIVRGVDSDSNEIVFQLVFNGHTSALYITAQDVTWNLAMLIALYAASASRRRVYWLWFGGSVAGIMLVHTLTLTTFAFEGFISHPEIAPMLQASNTRRWIVSHYNRFYEELGVQLVVIGMWLPYVVVRLRR